MDEVSIYKDPTELITSSENVAELVEAVKKFPIMKKEDAKFLMDNSEYLGTVLEKCYMWRTDTQKKSIINDNDYPTTHSKFHQAILEQKVQFEQTMYLAKEFENLKLDIQLLECDLEDLGSEEEYTKRKSIQANKIKLDMKFKQFELNQMQIQMNYRMSEIRGWQAIEEDLYDELLKEGYTEEMIWSKEEGELQFLFFVAINRLMMSINSNDSEGIKSVMPLAKFTYNKAKEENKLNIFINLANEEQKKIIELVKNFNKM